MTIEVKDVNSAKRLNKLTTEHLHNKNNNNDKNKDKSNVIKTAVFREVTSGGWWPHVSEELAAIIFILKMEAAGSSNTLITVYQLRDLINIFICQCEGFHFILIPVGQILFSY
jgi:hypothetical protein